jgi:N-acetylmuramate 1-kinase
MGWGDSSDTGEERKAALGGFLAAAGWADVAPVMLTGDASFRRYYRLTTAGRRAVLMDAPPPMEDIGPYIAVAEMLRDLGLSAPEIYAEDRQHGFLLIEDFGDDVYTRMLARGADQGALYALAIDTLAALHRAIAERGRPALPPYDEARLLDEAALLADWYAPSMIGKALPDKARDKYLARWRQILPLAALPPGAQHRPTLVLRDYHVDNLMLLPGRSGVRACGLLDFQDAVCGPASYDLVSLIEDARRDVTPELAESATRHYLKAMAVQGTALDESQFRHEMAVMAAQRNAKIVGIFARLYKRDGKARYLDYLPRVWAHLEKDLAHPALAPLRAWYDRAIPLAHRSLRLEKEKA